jgi:hypothetical protein
MNQVIEYGDAKGVLFLVSKIGEDGLLRHLVLEEQNEKRQLGKQKGDFALTGGETRKATTGDCLDYHSGHCWMKNAETMEQTVERALVEELGVSGEYRWKPIGKIDVDLTKDWPSGKIGPVVAAVIHVLLDKDVNLEKMCPKDPDVKIVGWKRPKEIFNGKNHRAGSIQVYELATGRLHLRDARLNRDKIIQATRYESANLN